MTGQPTPSTQALEDWEIRRLREIAEDWESRFPKNTVKSVDDGHEHLRARTRNRAWAFFMGGP